MIEHVVSFPVQVTVLSPLHIGSGERIDPKWFLWDGQRITLIDPEALLAQVVERRQVIPFEQFCLDPQKNARNFLVDAQIPVAKVAAYTLNCPERPNEILSFIKTTGRPYLPGSSLKGTVRSSLLRAYLLQSKQGLAKAAERLQQAVDQRHKHPGQELERLLFTRDLPKDSRGREILSKGSNYDLLRTMGWSDSAPLATQRLQILPVTILSARTNQTLTDRFRLYPELLCPAAAFEVTLKFDLGLLFGKYGADKLGLQKRQGWVLEFAKYGRIAASNLLEQDQKFYQQHQRPRLAQWCEKQLETLKGFGEGECMLPIGWGTGYDAKTVTDLFEPDLFEQALERYRNTRKLGRPSGQNEWLGPDLSPKTRRVTLWQDEEVPLGWIKLRF